MQIEIDASHLPNVCILDILYSIWWLSDGRKINSFDSACRVVNSYKPGMRFTAQFWGFSYDMWIITSQKRHHPTGNHHASLNLKPLYKLATYETIQNGQLRDMINLGDHRLIIKQRTSEALGEEKSVNLGRWPT